MTFNEFIQEKGTTLLARRLKVSSQNILKWSSLKGAPRPHLALEIIRLSKNRLDFEAIYRPYAEKRLREKKKAAL